MITTTATEHDIGPTEPTTDRSAFAFAAVLAAIVAALVGIAVATVSRTPIPVEVAPSALTVSSDLVTA